ncbi:MAG TPA: TlpA disulfide reductase family protein [Verrucomicrobiae bacterium]
MADKIKTTSDKTSSKRLRFAVTLLAVALALLAFEMFNYFSAPPLDEEQKALLAWEGVRAPDFSVTNLDGQSVRLTDLKGKRVIVNFWATWCVPCLVELPNFIKLRAETSPTNLVIIGLSTDDAATQKTFAQRNGINYSLAILQDVPSPYQDTVKIPVTLVIDRNGVIQHVLFYAQDFKPLEKIAAEPDFAGLVKTVPTAPK